MANFELREKIRKNRIMQYEIAAEIGVSEYTLCRWFRKELTDDQYRKVSDAIEAIKAGETFAK